MAADSGLGGIHLGLQSSIGTQQQQAGGNLQGPSQLWEDKGGVFQGDRRMVALMASPYVKKVRNLTRF